MVDNITNIILCLVGSVSINWGIMVLFTNFRKTVTTKGRFIIIPIVLYVVEVILVVIGVALFIAPGQQTIYYSCIFGGLIVGCAIGYKWGISHLKKAGLLCDKNVYKDLELRKIDIEGRINKATNIKEKQLLKVCEASITDEYSYWTENNWVEKLEKGFSDIKLYDGVNGYDALLCLASEKHAFSYIKSIILIFDEANGELYAGYNKKEVTDILNKAWSNFLHKEWLDNPQWGYDTVNKTDLSKNVEQTSTSFNNKDSIKGYMFCRKCGAKMPKDSEFCSLCGERFIKEIDRCPYCNNKLLEGARFCNKCGKTLV